MMSLGESLRSVPDPLGESALFAVLGIGETEQGAGGLQALVDDYPALAAIQRALEVQACLDAAAHDADPEVLHNMRAGLTLALAAVAYMAETQTYT